ncbi:hypothetical protein [Phenylobacterium sp.]|jgi:hypothetical protein|uniref:hypothetical protein n=1 Tax=Phenylobacterium sp. TaxID=1871053 RepID=UPI002E3242BB|nr:hypothetical protein [Phenylobacterium sp.]HEX3367062.1 hypothetical protein [Phenylobacterium sp.]
MDQDCSDHHVRFGPMAAAAARAIGAAWPVFLAAWAARGLLEAVQPILRMAHVTAPSRGFDPAQTAFSLAIGAATAVVSGLLIRWLLERRPMALRPDLRLASYVGLMVAWNIVSLSVTLAVAPHPLGAPVHDLLVQMARFNVAAIGLPLAAAAIALWPISLLVGDRLSPLRALRWMSQAYGPFLLAAVLLILPGVLLTVAGAWTHHLPRSPTDRLWSLALSSLTTTASTFVLAQVYSRRIRGTDLAASGSNAGALASA